MKKTVHLIVNPVAGGNARSSIRKAQDIFANAGYEVVLHLTTRTGDAEQFARDISAASGPRMPLVVAAGGDGTINEVANGLVGSRLPMAILPFGTTSVLAREIGVPLDDIDAAVDYAITEQPRPVSLGRVAFENSVTRFFVLMAGIGFDGEVVHRVNPTLKRLIGKGAYVLSTVRSVFSYKPNSLTITYSRMDGSVAKAQGTSIIVSNAARYGGDYMITPQARLTVPSLELMIDQSHGPADFLRLLSAIGSGRTVPGARYETVTAIRIDGVARMQLDGDASGTTPVVIDVVPDALQLVMKE
jgi:diacylglycerol kinase (ATP)